MKSVLRIAAVLGSIVGASGAAAVLVVGCGGDDSNGGGGDDAGTDVASYDAAGNDAPEDVAPGDATADAAADAGPDGSSPIDAGPPVLEQYSHQINVLFCQKLASCCNGSNTGGFDLSKCVTRFDTTPNFYGVADNGLFAPYLDGGHITFDAVKAQRCFDEIEALSCASVPSAAAVAVRDDCNAAVTGTLDAGATGCRGSAECVAPNHCEPGGTDAGICVAPRAAGAACGSSNPTNPDLESVAQCGSRVTGVPGYCAFDNNGETYLADSKCHPAAPLGAGCGQSFECASGLCGDTNDPVLLDAGYGACAEGLVFATQDTCTYYRVADGGK